MRQKQALSFIQSIESTWKGHELFALWLVKKINPRVVVDLGFDRGLSTIALAFHNRGHTYGIDWFEPRNYCKKSVALESAFQNIATAIQLRYVKNIHLIVGPLTEVSKKWDRDIDLLNIDWAHNYASAKELYQSWKAYLKKDAVILIHDVEAYPHETGRFFREIPLPKVLISHSQGLGVISRNEELLKEITQWSSPK